MPARRLRLAGAYVLEDRQCGSLLIPGVSCATTVFLDHRTQLGSGGTDNARVKRAPDVLPTTTTTAAEIGSVI